MRIDEIPAPRPARIALEAAGAFALFFAMAVLLTPNGLLLFRVSLTPFEGGHAVYRIWWFGQVLSGAREGSIWRFDDLLWPYGIPVVQQSNGMLKELLAAVLGGAARPWVAANLIVLTTPAFVGAAGYAVGRRWLVAPVAALAAGFFCAWTGAYALRHITPWLASTEATLLFVGGLILLRSDRGARESALIASGAGAAAGISFWICPQHLVHIVLIAMVFAADRMTARKWKALGWLALAGAAGGLVAAPLLWRVWADFGGDLEAMEGNIRETTHLYSATLSELLVPPPESFLGFLGEHPRIRTRYTAYLGLAAVALAVVGVWSRRRHTGFLAAVAIVAAAMALGPVLGIVGIAEQRRFPPGPFALFIDWPVFSSMRVVRRFAITAQMAIGLLAGAGVLELWRRWDAKPGLRWGVLAAAVLFHLADIRPVVDPRTARIPPELPELSAIAAEPGRFGVLDLPYGTGAHQYMRLGAQHGQGVVWGIGGRLPLADRERLEAAFAFPGVNRVAPRGDEDFSRFPAASADYRVRFVVVHDWHLRDEGPIADALREWILHELSDEQRWLDAGFEEGPSLFVQGEHATIFRLPQRP